MNWILPIVIGSTTICYINSFNSISKMYKNSDYTLTWSEFVKKITDYTL
jgi:hypothetical protein